MSLSSLMGDGSITGDGSNGGDGSVAGDGSAGTRGDRVSPYTSGAFVTTRDGIVGSWTEGQDPGDVGVDDGEQMRRWEAKVRGHVLDFELMSSFGLKVDSRSGAATLFVLDRTCEPDKPAAEPSPVGKLERGTEIELLELVRPTSKDLLEKQLVQVYNYADLRRDRAAEILSQIRGIETFFGHLCPLHPERHKFTLELLAAFFRTLVSVEMRIKHALAVPRPMEFSWQLMPMIQTPGHGTFPAGHAAEAFMLATVLSALMQEKGKCYAAWDAPFARLAARISVNRVIAGVHFPVDLAAGLVLGLTVGRYFIALAKGDKSTLTPYTFIGADHVDRDFPGKEFPWPNIFKHTLNLPSDVAVADTSVPFCGLRDKNSSPLSWLWQQALKEWPQWGQTEETSHGG